LVKATHKTKSNSGDDASRFMAGTPTRTGGYRITAMGRPLAAFYRQL
jgi:hypothetical protein